MEPIKIERILPLAKKYEVDIIGYSHFKSIASIIFCTRPDPPGGLP
jgi:hypothetical protein